jgi:predicted nucleic-acid-binding protein
MVVIDTDVLLLAFAFQNDKRQPMNTTFLDQVQTADPAITVYNLMELLGQLSFNLPPARLDAWQSWLIEAYRLTVIWPLDPDNAVAVSFRAEIFDRPYTRMRTHRMAFMDALVLNLTERTPGVTQFVTWNARHFKGKSTLQTLTPEEYLAQIV